MLQLIVLFLQMVKPRRKKFRQWTSLEKVASGIDKAVEKEITKFPKLMVSYISTALFIPVFVIEKLPWIVTITLYSIARKSNQPSIIPLLSNSTKTKDKKLGWDYEGRNWHYWAHILAKEYGWGLEYIAGLDVDVALAHIQEILTDDQLSREFLWSMSEIAYPYNSTTKQSKFSPLPRPYFMGEVAPELKTFKIDARLMPVGNMVDYGGMEKVVQEKTKNKAIEPDGDSGNLQDL